MGVEPPALDVLWGYGSGPLPPKAGQGPCFVLWVVLDVGMMQLEAERLPEFDMMDLGGPGVQRGP